MVKRFIMVTLALLVLGAQAFAQNVVTGKVVDSTGEPIVGAGVLVKGTTTGTTTDLDGNWKLSNVKSGAVLEFSSIGYATQQVTVNKAGQYNVVLEEDSLFLDDVVIVGYGSAKRKDLTGSLTQIDNKLIAAQNTSSATKVLEGAIPGLVYSIVDAQPGVDAGIRVRGLGSTEAGNSNALIVIDGIPAQNENPLSQLSSEDIASVTVLKDAASTAIYGSRGANGVVLVTTKSGQAGKTKVNFQARFGINTPGTYANGQITSAKDLYEYVWQGIYNSYRYSANGSVGPALDNTTGQYYTNIETPNVSHEEAAKFASQHLFDYIGSNTNFGRNVLGNYLAYSVPGLNFDSITHTGSDATVSGTIPEGAYLVGLDGKLNPAANLLYRDTYSDAIFQTGFRQQYDITASGGNEKENHYFSVGYLSDPSYVPSSKFDRITGRANVNAQLFPWLKVGANVAFTRSKTDYMGGAWGARNAGSNQGSIPRFVNGANDMFPFYAHDKNGNFIYDANGEKIRNVYAGDSYSPFGPTGANYGSTDIWYALKHDVRQDLVSTLNTRTYAEIPFLQHFTYRFDFSYDLINNMMTRYHNGTAGRSNYVSEGGYWGKRLYQYQIYNIQNRISYVQDFGKHHVDAIALTEYNDYFMQYVGWGTYKELYPGLQKTGNFVGRFSGWTGSAPSYGYEQGIERMMSYLGRANYIYDQKYYASASFRRDGSSKFRAANRWGNFWSVGAGWRFSSESFLEDAHNWLTNGKLRASYGVIGNQNGVGRYDTYNTWTYSATYAQTTGAGGAPVTTKMAMDSMKNTLLTWENTATFDFGLDLTLLNRVDITFDYFNRVTENSFFNKPLSYLATGQKTIKQNCAELTNRGIEIDINADIIRSSNFRWNVGFNATHYNTILTGLPADAVPAQVEGLPKGTFEAGSGESWSLAAGGVGGQSQHSFLRGVGRDWYNLYMYSYAGIDQNGLPLYWKTIQQKDLNADADRVAAGGSAWYAGKKVGDKVKTNNYAEATKQEVGDALPELVGGFNTSLTWKNWSFSAQFAYQLGGKFFLRDYAQYLYNPTKNSTVWYSSMNVSKRVKGNTWTPSNTGAEFPMQWYPSGDGTKFSGTSTANQSWSFTDRALFSASYLRLKNITVSYTAPKAFFQKLGVNAVSGMRIFASADNLFLLSAAPAVDPAMSIQGGYADVDEYIFPAMRTFTIGINLDF